MRLKIILTLFLLSWQLLASAQKVSVSTNVLDYLALGTMNIDVSYAFSRHWSAVAGVRYNPFTFMKGDPQEQFQYRQQSYSAGVRMWPWHILSGWWFASKLRYQEYNVGGILRAETREGDRFGLGLYAGYTHMISRHFNVEFGVGVWGGLDIYSRYSCPACGHVMKSGTGIFILPDDIMISLAYVF
jgi:hypothetical protein